MQQARLTNSFGSINDVLLNNQESSNEHRAAHLAINIKWKFNVFTDRLRLLHNDAMKSAVLLKSAYNEFMNIFDVTNVPMGH